MPKKPLTRRAIFWRLCYRSLEVKRLQAAIALGSLIVGAAVCSLLLTLYGGVNRKMTESFRALGANVILAPRLNASGSGNLPGTMDAPPGVLQEIRKSIHGAASVPVLYVVMRLNAANPDPRMPDDENVIAVGTNLQGMLELNPNWRVTGSRAGFDSGDCLIGAHLAAEMQLHPGDRLLLRSLAGGASSSALAAHPLRIAGIVSTGDAADGHVFAPLVALQQFAGLNGKISAVQMRLPGGTRDIEAGITRLEKAFPGVSVRPVRQVVYSEGKVLGTIRMLLLALTALILLIILFCVSATMTAIVLERRKDVAVMKALGASDGVVMRLFLAEGVALGLIGGLIGFLAGALVARTLAWRIFDVGIVPSGWVLLAVCVATGILAAVATMFPVRVVRSIQPAVTLKGV
ncbi:MAG: ABC transporter permease [Acidobacteriota bacterium]|nr:ABC transporter permease [Acidobacteriota bacterium]